MITSKDDKKPIWLVRPAQSDRDVLHLARNKFTGFLVEATLVNYMCDFVREIGKPYIIDPMLHVFSQPLEILYDGKNEIRRCYRMMAEHYGSLIRDNGGKKLVTLSDYYNHIGEIETIAENILRFQDMKCSGQLFLPDPAMNKYQLGNKASDKRSDLTTFAGGPSVYVAPYFWCDNEGDWHKLSLMFAKAALKVADNQRPVYVVIFLLPNVLENKERLKTIIDDYTKLEPDGFVLRINNWNTSTASLPQLIGLKYLVSKISEAGKPLLQFYGDFFSATLNHFGLSGFTSGLAKSEIKNAFKPFIPFKRKKGFKPKPNYYFYKPHRPVVPNKAEMLLKTHPSLKCNCHVCSRIIGNDLDNFAGMQEPNNAYSHFMNMRHREFQTVSSGLNTVIKDLKETVSELGNNPLLKTEGLRRWKQALED